MKVVLRADVDGVGKKGDVVDVADGFGRNKLIPEGLALKATVGAERQAESMRRSRELRNAAERGVAEEMATRLVNRPITIAARSGEGGKLFGSVTSADIVRALAEQANVTLDKKALDFDGHLKELGSHQVTVTAHPEVQFPLTVNIVSDE